MGPEEEAQERGMEEEDAGRAGGGGGKLKSDKATVHKEALLSPTDPPSPIPHFVAVSSLGFVLVFFLETTYLPPLGSLHTKIHHLNKIAISLYTQQRHL